MLRRLPNAAVGGSRTGGLGLGRGRAGRAGNQFFFSLWPPNSDRSAERILSANSPLRRDSNRSYSESVMIGAGTPVSTAAATVQRPSPESDTRPSKSLRSGERARASAVRSTSHDPTTEPRRHTSATSATSISYWYISGSRSGVVSASASLGAF